MSGIRFKRLERYQLERSGSTIKLGIPLPKTSAGKVDRDCPSPGCETRRFQIGGDPGEPSINPGMAARVRRQPGTPGTTCPYCGHDDRDEAFATNEDQRAAVDFLKWAALQDVEDAFGSMLESAFRGSKYIEVKRSHRPPPPQPRPWREDLLRDIACTACGRRYGVYAFALFCPNCGAANLTEHLVREKDLVEAQMAAAESGLAERERTFRTLSNALEDVVTALETALRGVYVHVVRKRCTAEDTERRTSKQAIGNRFQSLARGAEAFQEFGVDPYGALAQAQRQSLGLALAKRHVITHNQGMVDAAFVKQTGTGIVGRPVSLSPADIRESMDSIAAVLRHLERSCPELVPRSDGGGPLASARVPSPRP